MATKSILKLVAAIVLVAALAGYVYRNDKVARAERTIELAAMRSAVAAAVDSATRARITPYMDSLGRVVVGIKSEQAVIKSTIILNSRRNENLNKQIDSLNARLGVRPRF